MSLQLTESQLEQMTAEARGAAPEECCGLLAGRQMGQDIIVTRLVPSANVWEGDRQKCFQLDPRTHLRVQRECREAGLEIVGFYHSHPHSPPEPSRFDREMAWPDTSYVIISLLSDAPSVRSWRLSDSEGPFVEETLVIVPD